jgi:hypothetical protein
MLSCSLTRHWKPWRRQKHILAARSKRIRRLQPPEPVDLSPSETLTTPTTGVNGGEKETKLGRPSMLK